MPVSNDDYNVTLTSIANRLFNDPAFKDFVKKRYTLVKSRDWYPYDNYWLTWDQTPNNSHEHLQPKAPEKIPEGWE